MQVLPSLDVPSYRRKLKFNNSAPRTPYMLAQFVGEIASTFGNTILDLCAGDGNITKHITAKHTYALEKERTGLQIIQSTNEHIKTLQLDLHDNNDTLLEFMIHYQRFFDCVVSNPPFDIALIALHVSAALIKEQGRICFLLPTDYFTTSTKRLGLMKNIPVVLEAEFRVGNWNYYAHLGSVHTKRTADSIFVFRLAKGEETFTNTKYECTILVPNNMQQYIKQIAQ